MKMYIDDIRDPKGDFDIIIRNSEDAKEYMIRNGCPNYISFDHDLGADDTAMEVVKFMVSMDLDMNGEFIPEGFEFNIHSANPVGKANLLGYLKSYLNHRSK